ncbi:response regulator transcription factor [Aliamphritea spongicola]|nr:response regulator transcription factor [Aliamphritea spongicola]
MGADDYLAKPCNPRELVARIRAVLRRANPPERVDEQHQLSMHGIMLDTACREVQLNGAELSLTSAEFNVLAQLMVNAGQVVSKDTLTEKVLHRKLTAYDRAIDVHVSRVRQKFSSSYRPRRLSKPYGAKVTCLLLILTGRFDEAVYVSGLENFSFGLAYQFTGGADYCFRDGADCRAGETSGSAGG